MMPIDEAEENVVEPKELEMVEALAKVVAEKAEVKNPKAIETKSEEASTNESLTELGGESVEQRTETSAEQGADEEDQPEAASSKQEAQAADDKKTSKKRAKAPPNNKNRKRANTTSASRGIDFREVSAVVNYDFPDSVKAYTHRVGRTARGGRYGTALSLWTERDVEVMQRLKEFQTIHSPTHKANIKPLDFDLEEIVGFKIRVQIAIRNVTRNAVKEARLKELKRQMLKSNKLKAYFENNPREATLLTLTHDHKPIRKVNKLLAHIPSYIL